MIGNRMVEHNTKFQHRLSDGSVRAVTVKHDKKRGVIWVLDDGTIHDSPSSAGVAVTGYRVNGWAFWSVPGELRTPRVKSEGSSPRVQPGKKFQITRSCKIISHRTFGEDDLDLICESCKIGLKINSREIVVGWNPGGLLADVKPEPAQVTQPRVRSSKTAPAAISAPSKILRLSDVRGMA